MYSVNEHHKHSNEIKSEIDAYHFALNTQMNDSVLFIMHTHRNKYSIFAVIVLVFFFK